MLLPGASSVQDCWREALRDADLVLITAQYAAAIPPAELDCGAAGREAAGAGDCGSAAADMSRPTSSSRCGARSECRHERQQPACPAEPPASVLDAQVEALLERIAADRDRRCAQLRASMPNGQARDLLRSARKEARANVREAIERERKHAEQTLRQAEASAALEARPACAAGDARRCWRTMWAAISGVLEARWADAARRKSWLEAAVRQAQALLSEHSWRIEHGAGWSEDERGPLARLARRSESGPPRDVELACDPACAPASESGPRALVSTRRSAGLLASRAQIESEFLAQYLALSSSGTRMS